jgi:hypothetical protein
MPARAAATPAAGAPHDAQNFPEPIRTAPHFEHTVAAAMKECSHASPTATTRLPAQVARSRDLQVFLAR